MKKQNLFPAALILAGSLALFGCKEAHDHSDHDHDHDHEHGDAAASVPADTNAVAELGEAKPYPLDKCLVSDEKLGSMGEPIVLVHEGQVVKFCCESCQPKFEKDPAKYLAKLSPEAK